MNQQVIGALVLDQGSGFITWYTNGSLRFQGLDGEIGVALRGHEGPVVGALALADGAGFLSWSEDGTLRLWGAGGESNAVLRGHEGGVRGALALADGGGFLSWSSDGAIRRWDGSGRPVNLWLSPAGPITQVSSLGVPDQYLVVYGGNVDIVKLPASPD